MSFRFWRPKPATVDEAEPDREWAPMAAALINQPPADFVRLIFLGDISATNDRDAPVFDPAIAGALQSADLVIANCDSPIVRRPYLPVRSWLGQRRHMNAGTLLGVISAMGIETDRLVLSVANDSVLDQSIAGFEETLDTLRSLHIRVIGARRRRLIQDISVGSLTVGLVAFSEWRRGPRRRFRDRVLLTEDLPETDWLAESGQRPDIVCAFPHWDRRKAEFPSVRTQKRAVRLVQQGVGLIAGHHAQCIQPVGRVCGTYVAYGLGTFYGGAVNADLKRRIGAMFVVDICTDGSERGRIAAYELFPFVRLAEQNRERIVPLDALPLKERRDVEAAIGHLVVQV